MGIFCEICLFPSPNGEYEYAPGSVVSGAIKYFVDTNATFKTLTVSLKGRGQLKLLDKTRRRNKKKFRYSRDEDYVDDDIVVYNNDRNEPFIIGQYETPFNFQLPQNVPPSLTLTKNTSRYKLRCNIMYYICMKFETSGLNLNKDFQKVITVTSGETPRLATEPLQYSVDKSLLKLKSLFSSKKETVNIKGTITTSVVRPGETIKVEFLIENSTSDEIKSVKVKLVEVDKYMPRGHYDVVNRTSVDGTYYKYEVIKAGDTINFLCDIPVPGHCGSINHSKMIARDYVVLAIVILPMPHSNLKLVIPVQIIGKETTRTINASLTVPEYPSDNPPSYWEAMGEEIKGRIDSDEEGYDKEETKFSP